MSVDWNESRRVAGDVFQTIGRTPLVRLRKITRSEGLQNDILVKLEYANPTGSLKDRIYYEMITGAIARRELRPSMEILEASTGNAGIACSFVGTTLGYKVTIVMPTGMSQERMKIIRAYGANVITTPGGESDVDLCLKKIEELKQSHPGKYWEPAQYVSVTLGNYRVTKPERKVSHRDRCD